MSDSKKTTADLVFGLQIILAWVFSIAQARQMLLKGTQGTTITWFLFFELFLSVNLYLAYGVYQEIKDRKTFQILLVYLNWVLLITVNLAIIMCKGTWKIDDSIVSIFVVIGVVSTLCVGYRGSIRNTIGDPVTKGVAAIFFKGVPQLFMGYCIYRDHGGTGLHWVALVGGHCTVCLRLMEITMEIRKIGWNRKLKGLFIGEIGNWGSWIVTSIIWIAV